uniref:Uncharacterized protein n=1 Tax=Micrurus corallinus TaxID=54390 RepID=A0A2D4F2X4_MICCO
MENAIAECEQQRQKTEEEVEQIIEGTIFNYHREQRTLERKRKRVGNKYRRFKKLNKEGNIRKIKKGKKNQQKFEGWMEAINREGDKNWSERIKGKIQEKRRDKKQDLGTKKYGNSKKWGN